MSGTEAAADLSRQLKNRCAVLPSSVKVTVEGDQLTVRCKVQPEGDIDVDRIIKAIENQYNVKVDFRRID